MEIEIVNYIKEARQHGLSDQEIKQNLLDVGWEAAAVEDSFTYVKLSDTNPQLHKQAPVAAAPDMQPMATEHGLPVAHQANQALDREPVHAVQPAVLQAAELNKVSEAAPAGHLSDRHFQGPTAGKSRLFLIGGVALVALLAAGYFIYTYAQASPQKIWAKFLDNALSQSIATAQYRIAFTGQGAQGEVGLSADGASYINNSANSVPEFDFTINFGYNANGQSGSKNFRLLGKDNIVYLDLSSLTELTQAIGQAPGWIKLDLGEASKLGAASSSSASFGDFQAKLKSEAAQVLKNKKIFKSYKYVGSEQINGVSAYHLKNEIDKQQLKEAIIEILAKAAGELGQSVQQGEVEDATKQLAQVLDKLDIQPVEIWIGKKDFLPYKIYYDVKFAAPSSDELLSGVPLLAAGLSGGRDAQRLSDVKKYATALALYYNDHNGYPAGVNGVPQGLTTGYLDAVPPVPTPADGDCTDYYNTYWYTPLGKAKTTNGLVVYPDYELTFCLGAPTGGIKQGIGKLTPAGIEGGIACTGKPEDCHKVATQAVPPSPTSGGRQSELSLEITYSDYGKARDVTPPADAIDIVNLLMSRPDPITSQVDAKKN